MSFKAGSEVYYRVTFTQPISLDVCNCDSEVNDTYLMVYSLNQELLYVNDVAGAVEHVTTENMLTFRFLIFLRARTTLSWMVLQMEK